MRNKISKSDPIRDSEVKHDARSSKKSSKIFLFFSKLLSNIEIAKNNGRLRCPREKKSFSINTYCTIKAIFFLLKVKYTLYLLYP